MNNLVFVMVIMIQRKQVKKNRKNINTNIQYTSSTSNKYKIIFLKNTVSKSKYEIL